MRAYSKWLMLICLSVAACSDDKSDSSEEGVSAADAGASDSAETNSSKKSGSAGKSGAGGKASTGSGGNGEKRGSGGASAGDSKSASGDAKKDNAPDDAKKDGASDEGKKDGDKQSEANENKGDAAEGGKTEEAGSKDQGAVPTSGDQLSVCSRAEGDCNKGLACQAPATVGSPGRGFCSKICESDEDCGGVSPEGSVYTCTTGNGTNTCEIACSGTEDTSCPSGLTCVQTSRRRAAPARRAAGGAGGENTAGAGGSTAEQPQGEFRCRYPFEVSKIWGQCGDAAHECDKDLTCQGFWFGGIGHCTRGCEKDEDCAKPESGNTKPTCRTLVPAFGDTPAVKQCALSCADAKDDCPNGLACIEQRQPRAEGRDGGTEQPPTVAWCQ